MLPVTEESSGWRVASTSRRSLRGKLAPWLAMLCDRAVRRTAIAIAGLCGLLIAVALIVLVPRGGSSERVELGDWMQLYRPPPERLPGSPAEEAVMPDTTSPIPGEEASRRNALDPFVPVGPPAAPYRFAGPPQDRARARACLAAAMLYEAGNDADGQLAVGQVVLNRVRHPAFPPSVCGVVVQGSDRATGCQFTFTCDGSLARRYRETAQAGALARADLMLDGLVYAAVGTATHYHTDGVYPWWSAKLDKIARVGAHLFFRWRGYWGSRRAFAARGGAEPATSLFAFLGRGASSPDTGAAEGGVPLAPAIAPDAMALLQAEGRGGGLDGPGAQQWSGAAQVIPLARRLTGSPSRATNAAGAIIAGALPEGTRLLRAFPDQGTYYLQVVPGGSQAALRRAAETLCGSSEACEVYGWEAPAAAPAGPHADAAARKAASFAFQRVRRSERRVPGSLERFP